MTLIWTEKSNEFHSYQCQWLTNKKYRTLIRNLLNRNSFQENENHQILFSTDNSRNDFFINSQAVHRGHRPVQCPVPGTLIHKSFKVFANPFQVMSPLNHPVSTTHSMSNTVYVFFSISVENDHIVLFQLTWITPRMK